jgi:hypothetical protein
MPPRPARPAADDAFALIGLEPVDARRLVGQLPPDRQQQARHHVQGRRLIIGKSAKFGLPGRGELIARRPAANGSCRNLRAASRHGVERPMEAHPPMHLRPRRRSRCARASFTAAGLRALVHKQFAPRSSGRAPAHRQASGSTRSLRSIVSKLRSARRCRDGCRSSCVPVTRSSPRAAFQGRFIGARCDRRLDPGASSPRRPRTTCSGGRW